MSTVTDIPAASSAQAIAHFQQRLNMETDCSDVHSAMAADDKDFVLLHVVGSAESFPVVISLARFIFPIDR